jgi:hypothetical protein
LLSPFSIISQRLSLSLYSQTQGLKGKKDEVLDQNIKVSNYKNQKWKQKIMEKKMLEESTPWTFEKIQYFYKIKHQSNASTFDMVTKG